jgi:hypothetical protein
MILISSSGKFIIIILIHWTHINNLVSNVETLVVCNTQLLKDWDEQKKNSAEDEIMIIVDIFEKMVCIALCINLYLYNTSF